VLGDRRSKKTPVILSVLIDRAGLVQGYRIVTDPHAEPDVRINASAIAFAFKARYGDGGWECSDSPPSEGETPIEGTFIKQRCRKVADGALLEVEARHYYKPGQATVDRNTGLTTVNQFESSTRLQIVRAGALAVLAQQSLSWWRPRAHRRAPTWCRRRHHRAACAHGDNHRAATHPDALDYERRLLPGRLSVAHARQWRRNRGKARAYPAPHPVIRWHAHRASR